MATPTNGAPIVIEDGAASIDRENAFMLYASFCGDLARTAHALNVSPTTILRVADEEGWAIKLAPILELKKGTKPGDIERAMNRAVNFVQAHRMRVFVSRVMNRMSGLSPEQFDEVLFPSEKRKDGTTSRKFSTRAFADLASAMEKAHALSYSALNDTAPERTKRKEDGVTETNLNELHARLSAAMAEVAGSRTPRALLFDQQLVEAEQLRKVVVVAIESQVEAVSPHDDDDH